MTDFRRQPAEKALGFFDNLFHEGVDIIQVEFASPLMLGLIIADGLLEITMSSA